MGRISSLTGNSDIAIRREINSRYDEVKTVADNIVSVVTTAGMQVQIDSLETYKPTLDSVLAIKPEIDSIMADKPTLDSLFADKSTLDSLYADKTTLDNLYASINIINTVNDNLSDINSVSTNMSDINIVATNEVNITDVATNLIKGVNSEILNSEANANIASQKASEASDSAASASADTAQTAQDRVATAADRVQTGNDVVSTNNAKTDAETAQGLSESARDAASVSATNAVNSATSASDSANAASASENNAATSESNALTSANNAAVSADFVDDLFLGAKSTVPTTDNGGNAIKTGAMYYDVSDSGDKQIKIWDGSAWQGAVFSASGAVVSFNGRDGSVTLSSTDVNNALGFIAVELTKSNVDTLSIDAGSVSGFTVGENVAAGLQAEVTANTAKNSYPSADSQKLAGIEVNATADQTKDDIDALGINAATVNSLTVETAVPANAVFTDTTYDEVTTAVDGLMIATDKTKLDSVADNANDYVHPTNDGSLHVPATGTTNNGKVLTAGSTAGSMSWTTIDAGVISVAGRTGAVTLTKEDIGLGNVDNTTDIDKPISTATQNALSTKAVLNGDNTQIFKVSDAINADEAVSKGQLDTLLASNKSYNYVTVTTDYTAVAQDFIYADTSSGSFTITLPAAPQVNDVVSILDNTSSFDTNPLTVARNGNNIMGSAEDMTVDKVNANVTFIFNGSEWRIENGSAYYASAGTSSTPTLDISSLNVNENTVNVYNIGNYNANGTYFVSAVNGTVSVSNDKVTYTSPTVSSDTADTLSISVNDGSTMSPPTKYDLTVLDVASADTTIQVVDFTTEASVNVGWDLI